MRTLDDVLAPVGVARFLDEHCERAPLHLARGEPGFYAELLDVAAIDELIAIAARTNPYAPQALAQSAVELIGKRELRWPFEERPMDLAGLWAAYEAGASLRLNRIQRFAPRLASLGHDVERQLTCRASMNLYCTPPAAKGLNAHFDTHDVLILQLAGAKEWRLYDRPEALPLQSVPPFGFEQPRDAAQRLDRERGDEREPAASRTARTLVLEAGDLLYLPRGHYHEARTTTSSSIHVTIAIQHLVALDLLIAAITQAAHHDVALRRALSPRLLRDGDARAAVVRALPDVLGRVLAQVDAVAALDAMLAAFQLAQEPLAIGSTMHASPPPLDGDAEVEHVPGACGRVAIEGERAVLYHQGRCLRAPAAAHDALDYIARTPRFTVASVPDLDRDGQLVVIGRLIEDRFLRRASAS